MKFDNIIIGGGLAGLACGIRLQKAGRKCAVVSAGQSAMHFFSGSFELLGRMKDGSQVENPLQAIGELGAEHPYSLIGKDKVAALAESAKELLKSSGVAVAGDASANSWRITPTGERKAAWLTVDYFATLASKDEKIGEKALIVNILGFMDFNTKFLADSFERQGTVCRIVSVKLEEMERLRKNPSEMRASNIARVMDRDEVRARFVSQVSQLISDEDVVVLPAVFGLKDASVPQKIREDLKVRTIFVATMPPSVPGIRAQMALRAEFERLGGRFFMGDTVVDAEYDSEGNVVSVGTSNFGDIRLYADNFVLAAGSFFSKGLIATPENIYEPVFGLDLIFDEKREDWFDRNFWDRQNYISYGAKTNTAMNAFRNGKPVSNLYVAGSILGGCNPLYEGCGGGLALLTALCAAESILEK